MVSFVASYRVPELKAQDMMKRAEREGAFLIAAAQETAAKVIAEVFKEREERLDAKSAQLEVKLAQIEAESAQVKSQAQAIFDTAKKEAAQQKSIAADEVQRSRSELIELTETKRKLELELSQLNASRTQFKLSESVKSQVRYFTAGQGGARFPIDRIKLEGLDAGYFGALARAQEYENKKDNTIDVSGVTEHEPACLVDLVNDGTSARVQPEDVASLLVLADRFALTKVSQKLQSLNQPLASNQTEALLNLTAPARRVYGLMMQAALPVIEKRGESAKVLNFFTVPRQVYSHLKDGYEVESELSISWQSNEVDVGTRACLYHRCLGAV